MTDSTGALTPAEHRALAEIDIRQMRGMSAGIAARSSLALSAIAHTLAAVAQYLDPDTVTEPEVRLPGGPVVRARQSDGGHLWGYIISSHGEPDQVSRCQWGTQETALAAGAAAAITPAGTPDDAGRNGHAPVKQNGQAA